MTILPQFTARSLTLVIANYGSFPKYFEKAITAALW
jgi:hypothetical protein